jgi:hypothetical protein
MYQEHHLHQYPPNQDHQEVADRVGEGLAEYLGGQGLEMEDRLQKIRKYNRIQSPLHLRMPRMLPIQAAQFWRLLHKRRSSMALPQYRMQKHNRNISFLLLSQFYQYRL